jgi:uncharacterized NAD(P)/FAD-binding protein YdhS
MESAFEFPHRRSDVAIVGGGCSGALVATQLLQNGFSGNILLVEARPRLGHGLAYSTPFDQHLLNVPAGNMSAFPDEPGHFLAWLRARKWPAAEPQTFAPRRIYGEYIEETLHAAIRAHGRGAFCHIPAEVVDIHVALDGVVLTLNDGSTAEAMKVVLALGNPASSAIENISSLGDRWQASPWIGDALKVRFAGERILIVGAGLTAVDCALALHGQEFPCKTYMISRRALLPQVHASPALTGRTGTRGVDLRGLPSPAPVFEHANIRLIFRQMRADIRHLHETGACWRTAVDALRPVSNTIWKRLPLTDRKRFLRHLKAYWEPHRHRMAPQVSCRMDELRALGKVEVIAGRIRESTEKGNALVIRIEQRRSGQRLLHVDRAINCTGIHEDYRNSPRLLIRRLIKSGLASANDLGIGFRADDQGALIDARGNASPYLFTLGPPLRGGLFETTAVPEIRLQAKALVRRLMQGVQIGARPVAGPNTGIRLNAE